MADYKSFYEMDDITDVQAVKEHGFKSEVRELRKLVNILAQITSISMPGCLLTAPAGKTGTSSAKTWRVEGFDYKVRGLKETKAAAETALTATTHDTAGSKESWYLLSIASGGTLTITKGADQTIGTKVLPQVPDNSVPVAYMQIITNATGFDATTDDLAVGTGIDYLRFFDAPVLGTVNSASIA
jgi:hypothetical protein